VTEQKNSKQVLLLPVADILLGDNPREQVDQVALAELMQSMKGQGLLSPIGVRRLELTGKLKVVFGHRRLLAAKRLGWDFIEAVLIDVSDEKDALLKTSTENVIRENVSLPEQGRVFELLLKKGLTSEQISVRMGCSKQFVLNALEAFNRIPKKFHDRITFGTRGTMDKGKGNIPATVALTAIDIKRNNKLDDAQTGALMEWASKNSIDNIRMRTAGKLIADGATVKEATKQVDYVKTVTLTLSMKIATIQKLQEKSGMPIHAVLYKYLEMEPAFGLLPVRFDRYQGKEIAEELVRKQKKRRNR
jgi:ParB/RepB/Spo0J family partition protein